MSRETSDGVQVKERTRIDLQPDRLLARGAAHQKVRMCGEWREVKGELNRGVLHNSLGISALYHIKTGI